MTQAQERLWSEAFSDAELITAVREGDTSAYGVLYERHAAAARTVARQYVRSDADSDDVVSDAFARTLSVLQGGGGPDVTFRAYLFTVVRRLSYDLVNGARRTQPTDDERTFETAFGPMASTEDPTLEGFERSTVTRAYLDLPERWRAVLWYTEVENLSPADIAPILGLTANGVSALAYRAREGLRQAYLQQHLTAVPAEECRTVNSLLGSYVRGGLAKRETARVESHLEGCDDCRALVLELGDVSHGMRAVIAPLVFGVGALGLVGTALPVAGGAAVGTGAAGALQGSSTGGGASGGAAAGGSGASGGAGAAAAGATEGAGLTGAAAGAGGGAVVAGGAATGSGALAAAGAGGIVALVSSAPLAAAAVTVGVLAVAGLGVAGALGVFSSDPEPEPTALTSPSPSPSPTSGATDTPTDPATDPTDPANIPEDPAGEDATAADDTVSDGTVPGTGTGTGATSDGTTPGGTSGGSGPGEGTTGPTDPGTVAPAPGPAALDLSLQSVALAAREPADLVMTASNTGGSSAEEVFVDLTLPAGVSAPSSALVARGATVVGQLRAAALPCGSPVGQADGTSLVSCSVGVLAPGATQDLLVRVQAESGGEYAFAGSVRAKGVEPVRRSFAPTPVRYYGPEIRVSAPSTLAFHNPDDGVLRLAVRNSGDQPAVDPRVTVTLPKGLGLVTAVPTGAWTCSPGEAQTVTCQPPAGTTLAPRAGVDVPLTLLADSTGALDDAPLTVRGTAQDAHAGSAGVAVDVDEPWAGAWAGIDGEDLTAQCSAVGERGTATVATGYTNRTVYADLKVGVKVAGQVYGVTAADPGQRVALRGGSPWIPAGQAAVVLSTEAGGKSFTRELPVGTHEALDCFDWAPADGAAGAASAWVVRDGTGSTVLTGTFHNPYEETTLRVAMSTPHGNAAAVEIAPGAGATFTVDTRARDVASGTATFTVERVEPAGPAPRTVEARYAAVTYAPRWARSASVEARWQDGSVKLVGTLTNDSPETIDARMLGGAYGDSGAVQKIAPGQTATFTIDTRSRSVKAGAVTFRQYRWVLGKGFEDLTLRATHQGADYVPDWSASLTAATQCAAGADGVVLTAGLRNDSAEAMHVVARTPFGDRDLGDVAPGQSVSADLATGALAVKGGKVTFELSRTVLGSPDEKKVTAEFAARDCAVVQPAADLALGDPYYDDGRDHSYRPVSVVLDNTASNVPVTFTVSGSAKGSYEVAAGQKRTEALGEAPWSGASYTVQAGSWSRTLTVDAFSAAPQCYAAWNAGTWYDHDAAVSYGGWNYAARNGSIWVRPDDPALGWIFWERDARCGQG